MKILVVLRMVPDPGGELQIAEEGDRIDREWVDLRLNDFDDHALEEAILLKEATNATVIALAPAGDGIDRMLQTAIARGADQVIKLDHKMGSEVSSRALAAHVAAAARTLNADLVLTGVQTSEDVFGQLAPYVGGLLGWPHVSSVGGVRLDGEAVEVTQEQGSGISARLSLQLPAVLGIQAASQAPRYVSGSKLRQAAGTSATVMPAVASASLANGSTVVALQNPTRTGGAKILTGDVQDIADSLYDILAERGLVKERVS